jgi:predicted RNA-binding protein with RPS1 domain
LLHISEVSSEFVDSIEDHLAVGESVKVYIKKIDRWDNCRVVA